MAAGFEDSTVVLWSLNGYENYGRKPFQSFDDRLCQWSINNCSRILTDDLSDYESEEEIETNLKEACDEDETDNAKGSTSSSRSQRRSRQRRVVNKYKRITTIREQWGEYAAKSCSENNLWVLSRKLWNFWLTSNPFQLTRLTKHRSSWPSQRSYRHRIWTEKWHSLERVARQYISIMEGRFVHLRFRLSVRKMTQQVFTQFSYFSCLI